MTAVAAPSSDALRAPARPPDPPPITRKSNRVTSAVSAVCDAMLRRTRAACLRGHENSCFLKPNQEGARDRVRRINVAITRKLAGGWVGPTTGQWAGQEKATDCCVILSNYDNNGRVRFKVDPLLTRSLLNPSLSSIVSNRLDAEGVLDP
ncbi:hypothetical protein EYF80_016723 [Liparis tanakae]|uniref:Uncharacterized protein n=1 Tax=Liparis tanakae TaxID=230148 RepID=A0A4Z2I7A3_9TELE|nr:hypothetical protein EYF80_016723 [Liparis tanakae]